MNDSLQPLVEENNSAFAIKVEHYHYATKKREEATELYHIEKEAAQGVRVIKELKTLMKHINTVLRLVYGKLIRSCQKMRLCFYIMGKKQHLTCIILIFSLHTLE